MDGSEMENEMRCVAIQKNNPMELGPVISCVFSFLGVEYIKYFRSVCREWNVAAKPILRARSKVVIRQDNLESKLRPDDCINTTLTKIFSEPPSASDVPFNCFEIESGKLWSVIELDDFFQRQQKNIKELRLKNILLTERWGTNVLEIFDVTPWISKSPLANKNSKCKYSSKLSISSDCETVMGVDLGVLTWIKELSLKHCNINLEDAGSRSLKGTAELRLRNVTFFRNGNSISELCVNEILDFSALTDIWLDSLHVDTHLSMNLDGMANLHFKTLSLAFVTVINWESSRLSVDSLYMYSVPFLTSTKMTIKKLFFHLSFLDLDVLPQNLKSLIVKCSKIQSSSEDLLDLPNLKCLQLTLCQSIDSLIARFLNCPNLSNIRLGNCRNNQHGPLEVNDIPRSVKKLRLTGIAIRFRKRQQNLKIPFLVLDGYSLYDAKNILSSVQAKFLILKWQQNFETNYQVIEFLKNLRQDFQMNNVCVGPFYWYIHPLKKSRLSNFVDKEAHYYIFQNLKGKAIEEKEFDELMRCSSWKLSCA